MCRAGSSTGNRREFLEHALGAPLHEIVERFYLRLNEGGKFHQRLLELSEVLLRSHRFEFCHTNRFRTQAPRAPYARFQYLLLLVKKSPNPLLLNSATATQSALESRKSINEVLFRVKPLPR